MKLLVTVLMLVFAVAMPLAGAGIATACEEGCAVRPEPKAEAGKAAAAVPQPEAKPVKTACTSSDGCEHRPSADERRVKTACSSSDGCQDYRPSTEGKGVLTARMDALSAGPAWKWIKRMAQRRMGQVTKACNSSDC